MSAVRCRCAFSAGTRSYWRASSSFSIHRNPGRIRGRKAVQTRKLTPRDCRRQFVLPGYLSAASSRKPCDHRDHPRGPRRARVSRGGVGSAGWGHRGPRRMPVFARGGSAMPRRSVALYGLCPTRSDPHWIQSPIIFNSLETGARTSARLKRRPGAGPDDHFFSLFLTQDKHNLALGGHLMFNCATFKRKTFRGYPPPSAKGIKLRISNFNFL